MANKNQPPLSVLPLPTQKYDVQYFNSLIRLLNMNFNSLKNPGVVRFENLPTSPTDLPAGSVWNDSGTLKIV